MASEIETFSDHTEPLVDATGQLILAASRKDLTLLSSACQDIQLHLSQIVRIGANFAIAQEDPSFQEELAGKVNQVSDSLEKLIPCFAAFLQDTSNSVEKATDYATMAKNLGLAINELIVSADYSGTQKLLELVRLGQRFSGNADSCLEPLDLNYLIGPCRDLLQNQKRIDLTLDTFFRHASTTERKNQINARAEDVRNQNTKFVTAIQNLKNSPHANNVPANKKADLQNMNSTLLRRYKRFEEALKAACGFADRINSLYEQAIRLLKSARDLKLSMQNLLRIAAEAASDSREFVAAAAAAALAAKKLAEAAEETLENVDDPGRRYQIQQAIRQVLDNSSKLIQDAKKLADDPTNPELQKQLQASYQALDDSIQDLLMVADLDEDHNLLGKIHFSSNQAHALADMLDDPSTCLKNAEIIRALTKNIIDDARRHAKTLPPEQRAMVEKNCNALEKMVDHLYAAAERYAATGSDADRMKLDQVREVYQRGLQAFRKVMGLSGDMNVRPAIKIDLTPPVPESVIKGRQEADDCMEIVNFAREMVKAHPESENRDKVERGAGLLENLAGKLKKACDDAEENPFEPEYLEEVENLREKVKRSGAAILEHATALSEEELDVEEELPPEEKKAIEAVHNMEEIMASLEDLLANLDNLEGAEFLEMARLISLRVKEVTTVMSQVAAKSEGAGKERLASLSKILKDQSVQSKILASVVAAEKNSPGEQDTAPGDSFKTCARSLISDLKRSKDAMESVGMRSTASARKERMQKMLALLKKQRGF